MFRLIPIELFAELFGWIGAQMECAAKRKLSAELFQRQTPREKSARSRPRAGRGAGKCSPSSTAGGGPKKPRCLMKAQITGFHRHHTAAASRHNNPAMTSGTGPNTCGMASESPRSRRIFHFDRPPITGDVRA